MLCYVMLCHVMLCVVTLCCVVLCYVVLCYVISWYDIWCFIRLCLLFVFMCMFVFMFLFLSIFQVLNSEVLNGSIFVLQVSNKKHRSKDLHFRAELEECGDLQFEAELEVCAFREWICFCGFCLCDVILFPSFSAR